MFIPHELYYNILCQWLKGKMKYHKNVIKVSQIVNLYRVV